jgi:endonuclease/exonuclease/phosphatase family metal-dependent hydrolase
VLVVATANVLGSLPARDARSAVAEVVAGRPDLVALQEWHPWRWRVLDAVPDYDWYRTLLGGCVVGVRRDRFATLSRRTAGLSPPGRADRHGRFLALEPGRRAAVVRARDRETGSELAVVSYHLVSQVQAADRYREHDRPLLVARHRRESAALFRLVAGLGPATYACGDSNLHGFRIPGLVSAWETRADGPGTLGPRRQVDDVFGPVAPVDVVTVPTPSDHLAVVATYA